MKCSSNVINRFYLNAPQSGDIGLVLHDAKRAQTGYRELRRMAAETFTVWVFVTTTIRNANHCTTLSPTKYQNKHASESTQTWN